MTQLASTLGAALLLSTALGHAAGIVPGSDTTIRQEQSRQDDAVATGALQTREAAPRGYGYAGRDVAPAANRGARTANDTRLVPGSDSF